MKTRTSTSWRALGAVAAIAMLLTGCSDDGSDSGGSADPVTLKVASVNAADSVENKVLEEVAKNIEEKTDGSVKMELYPNGQLGKTEDIMEQAAAGELVVGYVDAGTLSTLGNKDMAILGGPFLFPELEDAQKFLTSDLYGEMVDKLASEGGLRVLSLGFLDGPRHIWSDKGYKSPDDLSNVKVRTPPTETWTKTFSLLGAVPTPVNATEVYSALEQGVVDAAEGPINGTAANKWYEVAPVCTLTGHFRTFLGYTMSEEVWQGLSDDQREVIQKEFDAGAKKATQQYHDNIDATMKDMESKGVTFVEADVSAYQKKTKDFYKDYGDLLEKVQKASK